VVLPPDFRVSVTDPSGKNAYPIASFTYLLVHQDAKDKAKGDAMVKFLWWAVHAGQATAIPLDYAPLPKPVVASVEKTIQGLLVQGKPVALAPVN
jgi:phosphate transport system substrate-binding protein